MSNHENTGTTSINLAGKKGLVIGIANNQSIAYGCASAMHALDAELAITYLNDRAEPFVRPLAEQFGSPLILPCDVEQPGQLEAVFAAIQKQWGKLDGTCVQALRRVSASIPAGPEI